MALGIDRERSDKGELVLVKMNSPWWTACFATGSGNADNAVNRRLI